MGIYVGLFMPFPIRWGGDLNGHSHFSSRLLVHQSNGPACPFGEDAGMDLALSVEHTLVLQCMVHSRYGAVVLGIHGHEDLRKEQAGAAAGVCVLLGTVFFHLCVHGSQESLLA